MLGQSSDPSIPAKVPDSIVDTMVHAVHRVSCMHRSTPPTGSVACRSTTDSDVCGVWRRESERGNGETIEGLRSRLVRQRSRERAIIRPATA